MGSSAKTPTPNPEADYQQYVSEGTNALRAQERLLSLQSSIEGRLQPMLAAQQMSSLRGQATGMLGLYGDLQPASDRFQQQYTSSQIGMMGGLGAQATQAAIGSLDPTTRGIYNTFGQQALEGLQAGVGLNAQETNQAQQAARAAAQARGLQFSRQGSDLEILNTYSLGQQRQQQRQAVAQAAYQMGAGQQQMGYQGYLTPAFGAGQQFGLAGMVNAAQSTYGALGQSSFLTPESQYLANIRANRIQMETAVQSANAQRSGAIIGGIASGVGSIIGGKLACWVAREVYGKESGEWLIFRAWLFTEAPEWFRDLYLEEGERFADFISDKPFLKSIVKASMDIIVKPRFKHITA